MGKEIKKPLKITDEPKGDRFLNAYDDFVEMLGDEIPALKDPNAEIIFDVPLSEYHRPEKKRDDNTTDLFGDLKE